MIAVAPSWGFDVKAARVEPQTLKMYDEFLKEWYSHYWVRMFNEHTTTYKLFRRKEYAPFSPGSSVPFRVTSMERMAGDHGG
jgi:hypothetical protein